MLVMRRLFGTGTNCIAPSGLPLLLCLFPGLAPWAFLSRPCGASSAPETRLTRAAQLQEVFRAELEAALFKLVLVENLLNLAVQRQAVDVPVFFVDKFRKRVLGLLQVRVRICPEYVLRDKNPPARIQRGLDFGAHLLAPVSRFTLRHHPVVKNGPSRVSRIPVQAREQKIVVHLSKPVSAEHNENVLTAQVMLDRFHERLRKVNAVDLVARVVCIKIPGSENDENGRKDPRGPAAHQHPHADERGEEVQAPVVARRLPGKDKGRPGSQGKKTNGKKRAVPNELTEARTLAQRQGDAGAGEQSERPVQLQDRPVGKMFAEVILHPVSLHHRAKDPDDAFGEKLGKLDLKRVLCLEIPGSPGGEIADAGRAGKTRHAEINCQDQSCDASAPEYCAPESPAPAVMGADQQRERARRHQKRRGLLKKRGHRQRQTRLREPQTLRDASILRKPRIEVQHQRQKDRSEE